MTASVVSSVQSMTVALQQLSASATVAGEAMSQFARAWLREERRNQWWARKVIGRNRYQRRYDRIYRQRWVPFTQVPR